MNEDRTTVPAADLESNSSHAPLGAEEVARPDPPNGDLRGCGAGGVPGAARGVRPHDKAEGKTQKTCGKCGHQGPVSEFAKGRNRCYPCQRKYDNSRIAMDRERHNARQRERRAERTPERIKREREAHILYMRTTYSERSLLIGARKRAKNLGLDFDLELEDIVIPPVCPLLGIPIIRQGKMNNRDSSPSIDRLTPSLGYVKGNIAVISFRANRIKNDATPAEIKRIAEGIDRYCKNSHTQRKKKTGRS